MVPLGQGLDFLRHNLASKFCLRVNLHQSSYSLWVKQFICLRQIHLLREQRWHRRIITSVYQGSIFDQTHRLKFGEVSCRLYSRSTAAQIDSQVLRRKMALKIYSNHCAWLNTGIAALAVFEVGLLGQNQELARQVGLKVWVSPSFGKFCYWFTILAILAILDVPWHEMSWNFPKWLKWCVRSLNIEESNLLQYVRALWMWNSGCVCSILLGRYDASRCGREWRATSSVLQQPSFACLVASQFQLFHLFIMLIEKN